MTRRALLSGLVLSLLLGACTKSDAATEPVWGKQACAHCAMVLSDPRFGAQALTGDGERFFFDDVGCMVAFFEAREIRFARTWVHDAQTGAWLDARSARYAAATSPMDFGFEARASEGVAWDEMRARVLSKQGSSR